MIYKVTSNEAPQMFSLVVPGDQNDECEKDEMYIVDSTFIRQLKPNEQVILLEETNAWRWTLMNDYCLVKAGSDLGYISKSALVLVNKDNKMAKSILKSKCLQ